MAKIRVQLVDGSDTSRQALRRLVEADPGLEVIAEASQGAEAIDTARRVTPDVVLMDMDSPGPTILDAVEVLSQEVPTVITVVLSSASSPETMRKAMLTGVHDFLLKPVEQEAVTQSIRNAYNQEWQRRVRQGVEPPRSKVAKGTTLLVFSSKGGVGRTTISVNLAAALQVHLS